MSSPFSTSSAHASNPESVEGVISTRGFKWRREKMHDVQSKSSDISFKTEWEKFVSVVKSIADDVTSKQQTEEESKHQIEKHPDKTERYRKDPLDADVIWTNHFMNVITNGTRLYQKEKLFATALLDALQNSLGDFAYPMTKNAGNGKLIVLRSKGSVRVGFGKEVQRERLGFKNNYALSRSSISDHGCFVFGTNMTKRDSPGVDETHESFYDMTAFVELKLEATSCRPFKVDEDILKKPDFEKDHAPMGQAMLYSMDMWHCLARRGICAKSVPVVVLAGKSEPGDTDTICCLEGHIEIPKYCGNAFVYAVDRLVHFNEVHDVSETIPWNSRDGRAIAIYIKTMRLGLERAAFIMEKYNHPSSVLPISLFCQNPLVEEIKADLIASPIPLESHLRKFGIRIAQGELFRLIGPQKESFAKFKSMCWFIDSKLPLHCLVKVSCAAVHNIFINHDKCKEALKVLYEISAKDDVFREEFSKVILGYCYMQQSLSLVTVLKDLQVGREKFQMLEHKNFKEGKLLMLWVAFCDLVKSILIPMADVNVVHLDIRSNMNCTFNILFSEISQGENFIIELRLIDFDSVVVCGFPATQNDDAVFWDDLEETVVSGEGWDSSYRYLFWQVLWIAFIWHHCSSPMQPDVRPVKQNTTNFLTFLFADEYFVNFKSWLGNDRVEALKSSSQGATMTAATIENALNVLGDAFCENIFACNVPK